MAREAWTEVLRPALADRNGKALFISTPKGFNHLHELVESAETGPIGNHSSTPPPKAATYH